MPRTGYVVDDQKPDGDNWNAIFRWTGKDSATMLRFLLFGDTTPSNGYVVGGLTCAAGSGATTDVAVGVALHYDATVYTSTLDGDQTVDPLGWQVLDAAANVAHSDNASGNPRIDVVYISAPLGTDRQESMAQKTGGPLNQNTRFGPVAAIAVVEGTPAGSPSAPAVPTGGTKLYEVLVPDGTSSANWSANVTYTDKRKFPPGGQYQRQGAPVYWRATGTTGDVPMLYLESDGNGNSAIPMQWSIDEHWPSWFRDSGISGEQAGAFYPMGVPTDRKWWLTGGWSGVGLPVSGLVDFTSGGYSILTSDFSGLKVAFNTGTGSGNVSKEFVIDTGRAAAIVGASISYRCETALDGTGSDFQARLYHFDASAGTTTAISDALTLTNTSTTDVENHALANVTETVLGTGDVIFMTARWSFGSGATAGEVWLRAASVQLQEGRA